MHSVIKWWNNRSDLQQVGIIAGILFVVAVAALFIRYYDYFPQNLRSSFHEIEHGTLIVGVSEDEPWTIVLSESASTERVGGIEAELITRFASTLDAHVVWVVGSESEMVDKLEAGELDVVIGGYEQKSVWSEKVALTRPYHLERVMLVRKGQNQLLFKLENFFANNPQLIHMIYADRQYQ